MRQRIQMAEADLEQLVIDKMLSVSPRLEQVDTLLPWSAQAGTGRATSGQTSQGGGQHNPDQASITQTRPDQTRPDQTKLNLT